MGVERAKMGQSSMAKTSIVRFTILVVDDDPTSLSIVSALLRSWEYEVVTVKSPVDALSTVRIQDQIDLVVTDLHMPQMSGIELQKQIHEEFKLPVIIMSSDDRESMILKCLAGGAVFYIVKPVSPDDLKNVWQYAVQSKKGKSILIDDKRSFQVGSSSSPEKISHEDIVSASSVNEEKHGSKKDCKRKVYYKKGKEYQQGENSNMAPKKAKVVWTNSLHNRFLQAIKQISLEKAVPKKILECMNVPGLTRENVASHLQKYRIFLKRVAEKGACAASKSFSCRNLRSSFGSGQSSFFIKNSQKDYSQFKGKQQLRTSFQPGNRSNTSALNVINFGSRHGASGSSSVSQLGLVGNQANLYQPIFGNTNPLYQAKHTTFGVGSNDMETNLLLRGGTARGPMNGRNSMQMHQQQSQPSWLNLHNNNIGAPSHKNFASSGIWNPSYSSLGNESMGTVNYPYSNYTGMRLTDDGELIGIGQTRFNGNGLNVGYGLVNGAQNNSMTVGPTGIPTFGYLAPGESSSSGFANYRLSPGFCSVNEQGNASMQLPPMPQQQHGLRIIEGQNDFTSDIMNNASAPFGNLGHTQQIGEGDISGILFGPSNYQLPYQRQGGEATLMNPNLPGSPCHAEVSPPSDVSLNPDFFNAYDVGENDPWINESSLQQPQEVEEAVNAEFDNGTHPFNEYLPSFDQNPNQQQGDDDYINSELNSLYPMDNVASVNQDWDDELLDSLFGGDHPF